MGRQARALDGSSMAQLDAIARRLADAGEVVAQLDGGSRLHAEGEARHRPASREEHALKKTQATASTNGLQTGPTTPTRHQSCRPTLSMMRTGRRRPSTRKPTPQTTTTT